MSDKKKKPVIIPIENGPFRAFNIEVLSDGGNTNLTRKKMALCRCGKSADLPFCDGSHKDANFSAPGVPKDFDPESIATEARPDIDPELSRITVAPDGPFRVEGNVPLAGTNLIGGRQQKKYALCRCGRSKEKPFCDGAHRNSCEKQSEN